MRATLTQMPTPTDREPIEALFASNEGLWLRVWASTQGAALVAACYTMVERAGGMGAFLSSPSVISSFVIVALLVVYHVIGLRAHHWIIRRPWAVVVYVPLGWLLIFTSMSIAGAFGLLVLGAIVQGFIFLPFAWAIATLTLVVTLLITAIVVTGRKDATSLVVARAGGTLATGIMVGTVMLYIHRSNRDAAIRARLLKQLDEAQRDLAERAREAGVQEERQRLARDIHDTLAQGFASVIRHLEAIELSLPSGDAAKDALRNAAPHLAHARSVSRSSLAEIRRLIWALRPPQLVEMSLGAAIERIVARWSESNGIAATCDVEELPPMQADAEVVFLRASQEALSNVARHANATRVAVALHCVDGVVILSVEDDGTGIADADSIGVDTVGIAGMRERVRRFGGHLMIESAEGEGTSISVALPLSAIALVSA